MCASHAGLKGHLISFSWAGQPGEVGGASSHHLHFTEEETGSERLINSLRYHRTSKSQNSIPGLSNVKTRMVVFIFKILTQGYVPVDFKESGREGGENIDVRNIDWLPPVLDLTGD